MSKAFCSSGSVFTINGKNIGEVRSLKIGKRVEIEANHIPDDPGQMEVMRAIRSEALVSMKIVLPNGIKEYSFGPVQLDGFAAFPAADVASLVFNFEALEEESEEQRAESFKKFFSSFPQNKAQAS
jgi:hypothetical protein